MESAAHRLALSVQEPDGTVADLTTLSLPEHEPQRPPRWQDHAIDLSPWQGKTVSIEFRSEPSPRPQPGEPDSSPLLIGSAFVLATDPPAQLRPPNVLLISLDTLRADHLGCYGYPKDTSPFIDAFAKESILFEHCFSPSPWTLPAHGALFTGVHPALHPRAGQTRYRLVSSFETLAETLRARGYLTAGITEGLFVGGDFGFAQGMEHYSDGPSKHPLPPEASAQTFAQASDWIARFGHAPFFLFVHTYQIHDPYRPPEPYRSRFATGDATEIRAADIEGDPQRIGESVGLYDGEIASTDANFGAFLESLRTQGLLDNTVVILFSDHGEEFGEHGGNAHSATLFRESLHVPLIIRLPEARGAGTRVDALVSLSDVYPTVRALTDTPFLDTGATHSLTPLLEGRNESYPRRTVVSELKEFDYGFLLLGARSQEYSYVAAGAISYLEKHPPPTTSPTPLSLEQTLMRSLLASPVRTDKVPKSWRALRAGRREYLFQWQQDPDEQRDLVYTEPETLAAMRTLLAEEVDHLFDSSAVAAPTTDSIAPLSDEERAELESMGYF